MQQRHRVGAAGDGQDERRVVGDLERAGAAVERRREIVERRGDW